MNHPSTMEDLFFGINDLTKEKLSLGPSVFGLEYIKLQRTTGWLCAIPRFAASNALAQLW